MASKCNLFTFKCKSKPKIAYKRYTRVTYLYAIFAFMERELSLLLAEDDTMVRQGIKTILEKTYANATLYEASTGEEALHILEQHRVDSILLDIRMPGKGGMQTLLDIKKLYPHVCVIVVTGLPGTELILNLLKNGADGIVPKMDGVETIITAIQTVNAGGRYFQENVVSLIRSHASHWQHVPPVILNERDTNLLKALVEGLTNKEIAAQLNMSVRTAETHRKRLIDKTQTQNTAGLIAYAYRNGIL